MYCELTSADAEWRKALGTHIADVGAQRFQSTDEQADGALLHACCAGEDMLARRNGEEGRSETHGGAGGVDVDFGRTLGEGAAQHRRVVAVGEVLQLGVASQGRDDEGAGGNALRGGQRDGAA